MPSFFFQKWKRILAILKGRGVFVPPPPPFSSGFGGGAWQTKFWGPVPLPLVTSENPGSAVPRTAHRNLYFFFFLFHFYLYWLGLGSLQFSWPFQSKKRFITCSCEHTFFFTFLVDLYMIQYYTIRHLNWIISKLYTSNTSNIAQYSNSLVIVQSLSSFQSYVSLFEQLFDERSYC